MSFHGLRRVSLIVALVLMLGVAVLPASAQCTFVNTVDGVARYLCDADDVDGLDVGSGDALVTVDLAGDATFTSGSTNGAAIYSTGGGTLYLVVMGGDTFESGDHAVLVDGNGNIVARGVISTDSMGLLVDGDGDITFGVDQSPDPNPDTNSELSVDDIAMWVIGSGSATNYGSVRGGTAGMVVGGFDDLEDLLGEPTSTGNLYNYGLTEGLAVGMGLFGNGGVYNYGQAAGMVAGMVGIGDVEIVNEGAVYGAIAGMFGYGSGTMTNEDVVSSTGAGMVFISRVDIDEQALEDLIASSNEMEFILGIGDLINSIEFEGQVEINNNGLIEAPVGVLLIGEGSVNNTGIIRDGLLGIGAYGNADITNDGYIYGSLVGAALIGSVNVDTDFVTDLFTSADPQSMSQLGYLFYIASALNAIEFEGGGTLTNNAAIGFDDEFDDAPVGVGMIQLGNGSVINNGGIAAEYLGMGLYGSGSVINNQYISTPGIGMLFIGDISFDDELFFDIENAAEIFADGDVFGPINFGTGNVTNNGAIVQAAIGIGAIGNVTINNTGVVAYSYLGIGALGPNVHINNTGLIVESDLGIAAAGDNVTVNNSGIIASVNRGVTVYGSGEVNNSDTIVGEEVGISVNGDFTVNLREDSITAGYYTAVVGDDGNQTVNVDGGVFNSGTIPAVVDLQGGRDRVNLGSNAWVYGDITMGEGDDTVRIRSGARVHGLIDGGEGDETDGDLLIVGDESLCGESQGTAARVGQVRDLVDSINLDSDTFDFDGEEYTIENFERGRSGVRDRRCFHFIEDGRINAYDMGAPVAGYCNIEEGLNVWPIDENGRGQLDFSVSADQMRTALQEAVGTGQHVLIAQGPRGSSLWALSSNEYQMMRLQPDGKTYVYIFEPGRCGETARLPE